MDEHPSTPPVPTPQGPDLASQPGGPPTPTATPATRAMARLLLRRVRAQASPPKGEAGR